MLAFKIQKHNFPDAKLIVIGVSGMLSENNVCFENGLIWFV